MFTGLNMLRNRANALLIAAAAGTCRFFIGSYKSLFSLDDQTVANAVEVANMTMYEPAFMLGTIMCWIAWGTRLLGFGIAAVACYAFALLLNISNLRATLPVLVLAIYGLATMEAKSEHPDERERPLLIDLIVMIIVAVIIAAISGV